MSENFDNKPQGMLDSASGEAQSMFQTWLGAVTKPTLEYYESLARHPGATLGKAALWVFLAVLVGSLFGGLFGLPFSGGANPALESLGNLPPEFQGLFNSGGSFVSVICGAPVAAVIGLLGFVLFYALQNWLAKMFGGTGAFDPFAYVNAAYTAPIALVTGLLSGIPVLGFATSLLGLYGLYLNYLAIQAVHKLDSGKTIAVLLIPVFVLCIILICIGVLLGLAFVTIVENM